VLTQDLITHRKHLGVRVANEPNLLEKTSNRFGQQHTGLTGSVDWSDRSHRDPTRNLQTLTREGPRQGERVPGYPSVGMPARTPSIAIETKEEQKLGLEK
jgi:hypothetical protein